jgi:hypothetical protein
MHPTRSRLAGYSEDIERGRNTLARLQLAGDVPVAAGLQWRNALQLAALLFRELEALAGECETYSAAQEHLAERLRLVEAHRAEMLAELEGRRETVE